MRALLVFAFAATAVAQPAYDLLLKGGHVIDPKNRINGTRDVAIAAGKIAAVAPNIAAAQARKVVDVSKFYVTPGLVDIHVHVYAGGGGASYAAGDLSVFPDGHTFRSGVTTVVDAGTSGWRSFPDFKERVIDRARTRVLSMLNIVGKGMGGETDVEQDTSDMDAEATAGRALAFKDHVVGIKTAHFKAPNWTAVDRAVKAATLAKIPVMVDFGTFSNERPFEELVTKRLRPGDIYTHFYLAWVPMLEAGKVRQYLFEARKRGIIFDVGHGGGSFVWKHAIPAMKQGLPPDSVSTDLHYSSMNGGMKDMLNVMSKFLNIGMSMEDVITKSTWNPAREIHREELGNLSVGAAADVAVLRIDKGNFGFVDVYGARLNGTQNLVAEMTVRDGKVVWDLNGITRETWDKLGDYDAQGDPVWDATIGASTRSRK